MPVSEKPAVMMQAHEASGAEMVTVAVRRVNLSDRTQSSLLDYIDTSKFFLEWKKGDSAVDVPLAMTGGHEVEDHLILALTPRGGAGSKEFELKVGYGDQYGKIAGSISAAKQ